MRTRLPVPKPQPLTLEELEREHIREVIQHASGNKTLAAQLLGIDRATLYRKLARMRRAENDGGRA